MGRPCDARVLQHHAAAGAHLRQRRRGAGGVPRVRRAVRDLVPRPRRQVPGPEGRDAPPYLVVVFFWTTTPCVDTTAGLRLSATQKKCKNLGQALDSRGVVPIIGRSFAFNFGGSEGGHHDKQTELL